MQLFDIYTGRLLIGFLTIDCHHMIKTLQVKGVYNVHLYYYFDILHSDPIDFVSTCNYFDEDILNLFPNLEF